MSFVNFDNYDTLFLKIDYKQNKVSYTLINKIWNDLLYMDLLYNK